MVKPRPEAYDSHVSSSKPARKAAVAPSAAICASAMSTNTTSRARTWTPRYAWIPVRTRHIRNGIHTGDSSGRNMSAPLPECFGEHADVVVDGGDVVVRALDGADRARQDDGL